MAVGSRYWANSFVITTTGNKMYLSNTLDDLEEQIHFQRESRSPRL